MIRSFSLALGFLTRLGPARVATPQELAASVGAYGAVGLLLGLLLAAPLWLGLFAGRPWIQAWLWLAANLWLTRGLHYDGLADVADAWGSGARGERFFEILKDSRLGAFGAMALVLAGLGQLLLARELLTAGAVGALALLPAVGRVTAVVLMHLGRSLVRPGLAALFLSGATWRAICLCLLAPACGLAVLSPVCLGAMLLAGLLPAWPLLRLAREQGAINGDFLGAGIVLAEVAAALGALALLPVS